MNTSVWGGVLTVLLLGGLAGAQPTFQPLGLAPTMQNAIGGGVSADGRVVVGAGNGTYPINSLSYIWTSSAGSRLVPLLPGYPLLSVRSVSGDGRIVVGAANSLNYQIEIPIVWDAVQGGVPTALALPPEITSANAFSISRDGTTIVGGGYNPAVPNSGVPIIWRNGTVIVLHPPPYPTAVAIDVSADGSVVVGTSSDPVLGSVPFRWTESGGFEVLPLLAPGRRAHVNKLSDDGHWAVGTASPATGPAHAVRWRDGAGLEDLGVPPGSTGAQAMGVSADGRIVVGFYDNPPGRRLFLYSDQTGWTDLEQFLTDRGVDLGPWVLKAVTNITPDGKYLVGAAASTTNYSVDRAWRIDLAGILCYVNCDASFQAPILNVNDFQCFMRHFAAGDPYPNCDQSTVEPRINVADFVCFLNHFVAGCQ